MKVIFHIDLNSFFATVEQILDPSLVGKPLVVGHRIGRGVVTTASYEARVLGIHAGMPTFQVEEIERRTKVKIEFRASSYHNYTYYASVFFNFLATHYTNKIEVASIDECYLDATDLWKTYGSVQKLAEDIIEKLKNETGLKCSIGISENKFLSKMASDMKKPLGYTLIRKADVESLLWPLPISKYYGIGRATSPKLLKLGIETIGDLARSEDNLEVKAILGKNHKKIVENANGLGNSDLDYSHNDLKTVGNSSTFREDLYDYNEIKRYIRSISMHVAKRANSKDLIGRTITLTLRSAGRKFEWKNITRQVTLEDYTSDWNIIYSKAVELFDDNWDRKPIRLLGVALNNVKNRYDIKKQLSLFEQDPADMLNDVERLIMKVNANFEKEHLMTLERYASTMEKKYQSRYLEKDETSWRLENQYKENGG